MRAVDRPQSVDHCLRGNESQPQANIEKERTEGSCDGWSITETGTNTFHVQRRSGRQAEDDDLPVELTERQELASSKGVVRAVGWIGFKRSSKGPGSTIPSDAVLQGLHYWYR